MPKLILLFNEGANDIEDWHIGNYPVTINSMSARELPEDVALKFMKLFPQMKQIGESEVSQEYFERNYPLAIEAQAITEAEEHPQENITDAPLMQEEDVPQDPVLQQMMNETKEVFCNQCDKTFTSMPALRAHQRFGHKS